MSETLVIVFTLYCEVSSILIKGEIFDLCSYVIVTAFAAELKIYRNWEVMSCVSVIKASKPSFGVSLVKKGPVSSQEHF